MSSNHQMGNPTPDHGEIDHMKFLSEDIGALYLNDDYSDVCLKVDGECFKGHRIILAARSEYFRALLYGGMRESLQTEVEIVGANIESFKALLKYIYTGQLSLSGQKEDVILDILGLAHQYGFQNLEKSICDYFFKSLSTQNVFSIYDAARLYQLGTLTEHCMFFIDRNIPPIILASTKEFLQLSPFLPFPMPFYVGQLHKFSSIKNDWRLAKPQMASFFTANGITDVSTKKALFLNSLDEDGYKLIRELSVPTEPEQKSYDELLKLFDEHFLPAESIFSLRHRFYNAVREENDTLHGWMARLRSLGEPCKFYNLDQMLLDRFVLGLSKGPVKDRLFEEDPLTLDIVKAMNIATAKESAADLAATSTTDVVKEPVFRSASPQKEERGGKNSSVSTDSTEELQTAIGRHEDVASYIRKGSRQTKEGLKEIIERDSFYAPEVKIFEIVMGWANANNMKGTADLENVLSAVRFELMSLEDLCGIVRPSGLVSSERILDALEQQTACRNSTLRYRGTLNVNINMADPRWGTQVLQGEMKNALLDGNTFNYDMEHGYTRHSINDVGDSIIIKLGTQCLVNHIRMLLWDKDLRSYSYYIEVSMDKKDWVRVIDHTNHFCRSWQKLYFEPRVVNYIRIVGTHNTVNTVFHVVAFEVMYTNKPLTLMNGIVKPSHNVATVKESASVIEGVCRSRNALLDGNYKVYDWNKGYTCHQIGSGVILVQLGQPYLLESMRLLLWDCDDRSYSYYIEVSENKREWEVVWDRREDFCQSWQHITFPARPIVFIKIVGTRNTANEVFHCVHFECPAHPSEPPPPSTSKIEDGTHSLNEEAPLEPQLPFQEAVQDTAQPNNRPEFGFEVSIPFLYRDRLFPSPQ